MSDNLESRIQALENRLIRAVTDLLYADPHGWSERPCGTCRSITALLGYRFGCDRFRLARAQAKAIIKEKEANAN